MAVTPNELLGYCKICDKLELAIDNVAKNKTNFEIDNYVGVYSIEPELSKYNDKSAIIAKELTERYKKAGWAKVDITINDIEVKVLLFSSEYQDEVKI